MEQEREHEGEEEGEETKDKEQPSIEIDVTIHNSYKGKITVPKGSSLKDVLETVSKQFNINPSEFQIILDGKEIDLKSENPVLTSNSTLALVKKIRGGKKYTTPIKGGFLF